MQPWRGDELVEALQAWLKLGHIIDSSDTDTNEEDEEESLFQLGERNRVWLDSQCTMHNEELRKKLYWYREHTQDHVTLRSEAVREITQVIDSFQKAALSRMVEHGVFWRYPGKGATLVEAQSQQAMVRCKETLDATREYMENWISQRKKQVTAPEQAADDVESQSVLSAGVCIACQHIPSSHALTHLWLLACWLTDPFWLAIVVAAAVAAVCARRRGQQLSLWRG